MWSAPGAPPKRRARPRGAVAYRRSTSATRPLAPTPRVGRSFHPAQPLHSSELERVFLAARHVLAIAHHVVGGEQLLFVADVEPSAGKAVSVDRHPLV